MGDRTSVERIRIIDRWNRKYEKIREDEKRKREAAEAKINFILLQQKIQENLKKINEAKENRDENKNN